MEHLRINKLTEPTNTWNQILDLIKDVTPWATIGTVLWHTVDKVMKYFADARESQLKEIVSDQIEAQVTPKIDELSKSLDRLNQNIGVLNKKLE